MATAFGPDTGNKLIFHVFQDERFVDLNLYQYGWERTEPLHSYGPHRRNHYLFHYIIAGQGKLYVGDKVYPVGPGQGFLILPGQTTTYASDEKDPWEYTWIEFDGLRVRESLALAGLGAGRPIYSPATRAGGEQLREIMLRIVQDGEAKPIRQIGRGFLFLDQLAESSAAKQHQSQRRLRDFYMKEALSFIEQNYQRDVSVEDIAAFCGLNRSYFGKLFRDTMGESPQAFLLHYRMAQAAQFLKETTQPVSAISTMVGYANPLHFSRAFKSVYGISPRAYRQTHFTHPAGV
ncbi:AraC family transcriptional regulator [Fournierella sp.]|uniref:AraC family transcriptional regulator n=1 Tax=Allofournierella sp. TaxID=1940256 RepID=UPI0025BAAD72|nr:AraC family transcriptional regulator [Fournierella sp.]